MRVLDLFSGIGAYSLGLERTGGFKTVAFCERDAYCRKVLTKHWPDIPCYENVEHLTGARLRADGIVADFIVAGWPCQDISVAGTGRGLDGERSGLWPHIARIAGEISARGLLLENSTNLLAINGGRDFGRVLGDLAALGYNVEWHCLPAAAFDAPHIRDRLWIVGMAADRHGAGCGKRRGPEPIFPELDPTECAGEALADNTWDTGPAESAASGPKWKRVRPSCEQTSSDNYDLREHGRRARAQQDRRRQSENSPFADPDIIAPIGAAISRHQRHQWEPESGLARVVSGVANRVHRIRALGNTNPPVIPEIIGRAIMEAMAA